MLDLKWTEAMKVDVDELDEDHRIAIATMSHLRTLIAQREAMAAVRVCDDLLDLSRLHFLREERMLAECGFPMLARHVKGHRDAEAQLLAMRKHVTGPDWPATEASFEVSCETFLFRLILDDLDYKVFLLDKGIKPRFSGIGVAEWLPRPSLFLGPTGKLQ